MAGLSGLICKINGDDIHYGDKLWDATGKNCRIDLSHIEIINGISYFVGQDGRSIPVSNAVFLKRLSR